MELKEIKKRADALRKDLPMGVWLNQNQLCQLADISSVTLWRLPEDQKPHTIRMGGSELIQVDAAVRWANDYWTKRREREDARGGPFRTKETA